MAGCLKDGERKKEKKMMMATKKFFIIEIRRGKKGKDDVQCPFPLLLSLLPKKGKQNEGERKRRNKSCQIIFSLLKVQNPAAHDSAFPPYQKEDFFF